MEIIFAVEVVAIDVAVEDEILASAKVSETMTVENERQQHVSKREEYVAVATEEKQLRFGRFCFPFISFVFGLILILLYCCIVGGAARCWDYGAVLNF